MGGRGAGRRGLQQHNGNEEGNETGRHACVLGGRVGCVRALARVLPVRNSLPAGMDAQGGRDPAGGAAVPRAGAGTRQG